MLAEMLQSISSKPKTLPLMAALDKLDIQPFSREAVDKYKEDTLNFEMQKVISKFTSAGWARVTEHHEQHYPIRGILGTMDMTGVRYEYFYAQRYTPRVVAMKWHTEGTRDVPEFVGRKMAMITAEMPGATFETDILRSQDCVYDPLIKVKFGDEEYYFEVWGDDDHKFPR